MLKKCMLTILLISVLMVASFVVFAEEESTEEYVYIINPEVGTSGKAIVNDTMFISIYVQSKSNLKLELIKNDTPVFGYEESLKTIELDGAAKVEEKITLFDVMTRNKSATKETISKAYQQSDIELKKLSTALISTRKKIREIPSVVNVFELKFDDTYELTEDEFKTVEFYKGLIKSYNEELINYNYWKNAYTRLFDKVIFKNVDIAVNSSFPYFEYSVENIQPGHYKLKVINESGRVIERLDFEVVTEKNIANEILGNKNFFDSMINQEVFE